MAVGRTRPISVASCSGPLGIGSPSPPAGFPNSVVCDLDERRMKHRRRGAEDPPDLHRAAEFRGRGSAGSARVFEHRGEHPGIQVTLIELHLGAAGDRRDHPGRRFHATDGGDAAVGDRRLAGRQRGPRGGGQ
jgi:hypothetical protein